MYVSIVITAALAGPWIVIVASPAGGAEESTSALNVAGVVVLDGVT